MLLLLYNKGVRVSELLAIKYSDLRDFGKSRYASIKIYGKGRKERIVPLWKTTTKYIRKYPDSFGISDNDRLFTNKNGAPLTRSGVTGRIEKLTQLSATAAPSLIEKNITPPFFRHSVAMNLLQAGVDISTIAIWLGDSSIETTHKYMVVDLELKRKAMEKARDSGTVSYKYKPFQDILAFLIFYVLLILSEHSCIYGILTVTEHKCIDYIISTDTKRMNCIFCSVVVDRSTEML